MLLRIADEGDGEGNVLDRLQRVEEMLLVAFGDSRDSTLASNTLDAFESPARPVDSQKLATSGPISPLLAAAVTELANIRKEMQRPAEQSKGRSEDYEQNEYRRSRNEEVKRDSTQSDGEKIQDSAKNDMEDSTD